MVYAQHGGLGLGPALELSGARWVYDDLLQEIRRDVDDHPDSPRREPPAAMASYGHLLLQAAG